MVGVRVVGLAAARALQRLDPEGPVGGSGTHVGPNVVPSLAREGCSWSQVLPSDVWVSVSGVRAEVVTRQCDVLDDLLFPRSARVLPLTAPSSGNHITKELCAA